MTKKTLFTLIILSIPAFLASFANAAGREVNVETVDWPPYYGKTLPNNGPLAEITRAAFDIKGYKMSLKFTPWQRALNDTESGKADMVLGAYDTEERRQSYHMSDSIYEVKEMVIGLESTGVTSFSNLMDLKGFKFGTTRGYAYSKEFDEATTLYKDPANSDLLSLRKLLHQRVDFIVMNIGTFKENLAQIDTSEHKPYVFLSPPLSVISINNIFSRNVSDGEQLMKDFNEGLKEIKINGTYDEILHRSGL